VLTYLARLLLSLIHAMPTGTLTSPSEFLKGSLPKQRRRGQIDPVNGSRYSGKPPAYYCEAFGKALLPHLIAMLRDGKDKEFLPLEKEKIETVYQRCQQSFAYCIDKLDEKGVLESLRQRTKFCKTQRGVVLCFLENADLYAQRTRIYETAARSDAFVVRDATSVNWREELHKFFEDLDKQELRLTDGFALDGTMMAEIRTMCDLMPPDMAVTIVKLSQFEIHLKRTTL